MDSSHRDHEIQKLQVVYDKHRELIRNETHCLRRRLKDLNFHVTEVQSTIEKVNKCKEERFKELENFLENCQAKILTQQKLKNNNLIQQKAIMAGEIE